MSFRSMALLLLCLCAPPALGRTLLVTTDGAGDCPTIQAAVDAAAPGDTVCLADGLYRGPGNRDVELRGKDLTIRSYSGDPTLCTIDCEGSATHPHRGFTLHNGRASPVVLQGLTIRNGYATTGGGAVWLTGEPYPVPILENAAQLLDCRLEQNTSGERGVIDVSPPGDDGGDYYHSHLLCRSCVVTGNQGHGLRATAEATMRLEDCEFSLNTGHGLMAPASDSGVDLVAARCRFDRNAGDGIAFTPCEGPVHLTDCELTDNGGYGLQGWVLCGLSGDMTRCTVTGNGTGGIRYGCSEFHFTVADCVVSDNGGDGVFLAGTMYPRIRVLGCRIERNEGDGVHLTSFLWRRDPEPTGGLKEDSEVADCEIAHNAGGGVSVFAVFAQEGVRFVCRGSTIHHNGASGVRVEGDRIDMAGCTLVANAFDGLRILRGDGQTFNVDNSLFAFNGGRAVAAVLDDAVVQLSFCDLFGNHGGDWTPPIDGQAGVDGNLEADPLFCDWASEDFGLQAASPCAPELAGGAVIGARPVTCPAAGPPRIAVCDVPGDQGGLLRIAWPRFPEEEPRYVRPVLAYEVQRLGEGWRTIATLAASGADTYALVVETPDVEVAGQLRPWSTYRVRGCTADSARFHLSGTADGCSVDNLAPPRPEVTVVDDYHYRVLAWTPPDVPDLGLACVYRGGHSGFRPENPVACTDLGVYYEPHRIRYFYRVRFSDIHGNRSEFSEEVVGRYPTGVAGDAPLVLRLHPNAPNPFNPVTTLRFDVPAAGRVRLAVYDARGKRVRGLVDSVLSPGSHEAVWDGRDDAGRALASGSYSARLEAGGAIQSMRVGLVR